MLPVTYLEHVTNKIIKIFGKGIPDPFGAIFRLLHKPNFVLFFEKGYRVTFLLIGRLFKGNFTDNTLTL